jgi:hypothetical protein
MKLTPQQQLLVLQPERAHIAELDQIATLLLAKRQQHHLRIRDDPRGKQGPELE